MKVVCAGELNDVDVGVVEVMMLWGGGGVDVGVVEVLMLGWWR